MIRRHYFLNFFGKIAEIGKIRNFIKNGCFSVNLPCKLINGWLTPKLRKNSVSELFSSQTRVTDLPDLTLYRFVPKKKKKTIEKN